MINIPNTFSISQSDFTANDTLIQLNNVNIEDGNAVLNITYDTSIINTPFYLDLQRTDYSTKIRVSHIKIHRKYISMNT